MDTIKTTIKRTITATIEINPDSLTREEWNLFIKQNLSYQEIKRVNRD